MRNIGHIEWNIDHKCHIPEKSYLSGENHRFRFVVSFRTDDRWSLFLAKLDIYRKFKIKMEQE